MLSVDAKSLLVVASTQMEQTDEKPVITDGGKLVHVCILTSGANIAEI